jgi:molybdate transport system substrate-binding protein
MDYPQKLIKAGGAEGSSLVTFAFGRLVLWTMQEGIDLTSINTAVRNPAVRKIAIANPRTAPYGRAAGRAAEDVLAKLGLGRLVEGKIVYGENISQTAQFVSSGNAELGFVALSLVIAPNSKPRGRWLEVPPALYSPIAQGAVLTTRGAARPAARRYLHFLRSPAARSIFAGFGYGLP